MFRHRRVEVDAFRHALDKLSVSPRQSCEPTAVRKLLQRDRSHGQRCKAHLHQRFGAACAKHEEFVSIDRRRKADIAVEISMPVGDVLLPPRKIATAFLAIFRSRQDIETVNRVDGEVDRATVA